MPEMTDTDLLAEFERLAAAATPGEWDAIISSEAVRYLGPPVGSHEHGDYVAYTPLREDKEFIAFARNNASRLIELARRAETTESDLASARATIATYRSRYGCLSCGEQHPTESMCPPHEVRTTGLAGIDEERKALTRGLS